MPMTVKTEDKLALLESTMPQLMDYLAALSSNGQAEADDILDLLCMGIASLLDNDSQLATPRDLRLGAQTATKRIEARAKEFRAMQDQAGVSWLKMALSRATSEALAVN